MGKPINDSNMAKAMNLIDLRKRLKRPETPKYELANDNLLRHEYRPWVNKVSTVHVLRSLVVITEE